MVFIEDPWSRIVAVHWKDKGDPPDIDDLRWPCGAFRHGYALSFYGEIPGQSIFVLHTYNIYGIGFDLSPNGPDLPNSYWWSTADYLIESGVAIIDYRDVPYIWGPATKSWTVTLDEATLAERILINNNGTVSLGEVRMTELRNINVQSLAVGSPRVEPDRIVPGNTITILAASVDEIFPPAFRVQYTLNEDPTAWRDSVYPPTLVQAHCFRETAGGYPPPPEGVIGNPYYIYPAGGSSNWPIRPPPPPPFSR